MYPLISTQLNYTGTWQELEKGPPSPHQPINVGKKQQPPKRVPLGSLPVNKTWAAVTQLLLTTQGRAFVRCANYMIPQKIKSADNRVISGVWQGIVLWAGSHLLSGQ